MDICFFQNKALKWRVFSSLTIVTRGSICRIRLEYLALRKKSRKKKPFCSRLCCASKPFQRDIAKKRFKVLIINACGEKVHKCVGISKTLICNRFSKWCQKLRKMMHIDASPESSIFVPKVSECLNWVFQLIYFLVIVSILGFRRLRSQNLSQKKCYTFYLCYPKILAQNSRFTKKCWISVESPASWSDEKFSSTLRRVKSSIERTLVTLISTENWGINQI